jgi:acetamidase/formamidase/AraC-like DNA-binding protein
LSFSQFTTESYLAVQRIPAWQTMLASLHLNSDAAEPSLLYGAAKSATSGQGMSFAHLAGSPQTISCQRSNDAQDFWLAQVLEGQATVRPAPGRSLSGGETAYGLVGSGFDLEMTSSFRILFIRIPGLLLGGRLIRPFLIAKPRTLASTGSDILLSGMLSAAAEGLETLTGRSLQSLEMAVMEFLMTILAAPELDGPRDPSATQHAVFYRICQAVEARLGDTSLRPADIAAAEGLSIRYVHKAFDAAGQTFGTYLRNRRLDRCRADLTDPLQVKTTVAEIALRWGFGDAAHFSHAFRDRFGHSPSSVRHAGAASVVAAPHANRGRPSAPARKPLPRRAMLRCDPSNDADEGERAGTTATGAPLPGAHHHYLAATKRTVHWGYFSRSLPPVLEVSSGDVVTIETLTHHAYDDHDRMIFGDNGAEEVFRWTQDGKTIDRRGAGPMDASIYGRGAGEGFGVHICTGPVAIRGAMPGDVLEIRILEIAPRPSGNPAYRGRTFGSNAASWWGFQYSDLLTEPRPREVVTIYELDRCRERACAHAVYNFRWTPQTDPFGVVHATIDYPGVPVDHKTVNARYGILKGVHVPVRPHFGVIGLAPNQAGYLDSVPPSFFGGNIDNWRIGAGASLYLPIAVSGALLSVGDPHASQGDGELCGTAIECSLTGTFELVLHRKEELNPMLADLNYPLIDTGEEWVLQGFSQPNYLGELGDAAQSEIYKRSSLDTAMRDAFRKARRFLMSTRGLSEDEAISLISVGVDFGVTQVVDGNWGIHAIIAKRLFESE